MCFLEALKKVSRPPFSIFFLWILPLCHVPKYIGVQPWGASDIFAKAEWRVRTTDRLRWTIWTGNGRQWTGHKLAMNRHWTGNGLAKITQISREGTQGKRRKLESFRARPIGPRGPQMRPDPMHIWAHYPQFCFLRFLKHPRFPAFRFPPISWNRIHEFCFSAMSLLGFFEFYGNSTEITMPLALKVGGRTAATPIREEVAPTSSRKLGKWLTILRPKRTQFWRFEVTDRAYLYIYTNHRKHTKTLHN